MVVPSLLQLFTERYGTHLEAMSDQQFEVAVQFCKETFPGIMP